MPHNKSRNSMYLCALLICCTTVAGTGRSEIERLNPLSTEVISISQSGTCAQYLWSVDDDGALAVAALPVANIVPPGGKFDNWVAERESGGGRVPNGVKPKEGTGDRLIRVSSKDHNVLLPNSDRQRTAMGNRRA